jgi:hypothetical protein
MTIGWRASAASLGHAPADGAVMSRSSRWPAGPSASAAVDAQAPGPGRHQVRLIFARYAGDPVIPLRLFRDRTFRIACGRSQQAACLPLACAAAAITRPPGELRRSTIRVSR